MLSLKVFSLFFVAVLLLSLGASIAQATRHSETAEPGGWATARRDSSGIAPDPRALYSLAIVQVYAADLWLERGGGGASVDHLQARR